MDNIKYSTSSLLLGDNGYYPKHDCLF